MRSRKDDGGLSALAVVVAVFLVSATAAVVPNHAGNAGAKVAEVDSRVDRQWDDTQAACTDIRELIPEQKNLAAVWPDSYANESTSGNNSEFKYASPNDSSNDSGDVAMPKNGGANAAVDNGSNDRRNSIYGINPANVLTSDAPESADKKDDQDAAGDADQIVPPTLTFNGRAREIQGDRVLTQRQEALDRIVSNWTPRYVAAGGNTRNRWSESTTPASYGPSAGKSRSPSSNGRATRSWAAACTGHWSTIDDTKVYDRWRRQASDV